MIEEEEDEKNATGPNHSERQNPSVSKPGTWERKERVRVVCDGELEAKRLVPVCTRTII